jgi:hypothetical protein
MQNSVYKHFISVIIISISSFSFSYGGMNALANSITGIAGRLTKEEQVNEVSNFFYDQEMMY